MHQMQNSKIKVEVIFSWACTVFFACWPFNVSKNKSLITSNYNSALLVVYYSNFLHSWWIIIISPPMKIFVSMYTFSIGITSAILKDVGRFPSYRKRIFQNFLLPTVYCCVCQIDVFAKMTFVDLPSPTPPIRGN